MRSAKVEVALPEEELTADFLSRTRIRTPDGNYVQLSEIVSVSGSLGFSTVRRENGLRIVEVTGDLSEDDPVRADAEIMDRLDGEILPGIAERFGVEYVLGGLAEQEQSFLADAALGFALCLLGIYLTLSWIFASWTRPLVVMSVIPFGLIGVIYGHWAWDVPMSIFTVVGLIGMTGIIINDSIVLITTIDEYAEKRGLVPAIVDAACDRLRPILLTTLTTVLGLAPLLYETSQQAQFLKPTVITLAYGLGAGMFLVLLIVPALVASQQDVGRMMRSLRRGVLGGRSKGVTAVLALSLVLSGGVLAATVGHLVLRGELWAPLEALRGVPLPDTVFALAALAVGLVLVFVVSVVLGALTLPKRRVG